MATAASLGVLPRPALEARLDETFGKRLTLVVAHAGYGKSTLLATWTADVASTWYTVSAKDRSLSTFGAGIANALALALGASDGWTVRTTAETVDAAEALAGLVARRLATELAHDLVLVVDDAHELRDSVPALRFVESLCRQGPAMLHVVLATREPLSLRTQRLRGQGAVLELTGSDLAFTYDEVAALAEGAFGRVGAELARDLHALTGGWPAAVRLALEALRRVDDEGKVGAVATLQRPDSPLFTYLAHEVFDQTSQETREVLRRIAEFDRFTPALCEAIGLVHAPAVIALLGQRGLFILERDGWLSLHALVRDFAVTTWPLSTVERRALLTDGATWLVSIGQYGDAARAYGAAGAFPELHNVLTERGPELLLQAGEEAVIEFARRLPAELRDADVHLLAGDAFVERGEIDDAVAAYSSAAGDSARLEPRVAWRLLRAHYLAGDLTEAAAIASRATEVADDLTDAVYRDAWLATVAATRGDTEEARHHADAALEATAGCEDDRAVSDAHVAGALIARRDSAHVAEHHHRVALEAAIRAGDAFRVARVRNNIGFELLERGEYRAAIDEFGRAIESLEPLPNTSSLHAILSRGVAYWFLGRLDEARADFADTLARSGESDPANRAWALVGLGDVQRERGNAELARSLYARGLEIMEEWEHQDALVITICALARTLVDADPDEALRLSERALELRSNERAWALNARGWVALALGDAAKAALCAEEALALARRRLLAYETAEALELAAITAADHETSRAHFEQARTTWSELGNEVHAALVDIGIHRGHGDLESQRALLRAERTLRTHGVRCSVTAPASLLRAVSRSTETAVAIHTLGGFVVIRNGVALSESDWQSRKARELLKILVARRGRATSREVLMEALWPGHPPEAVSNRLSVALSTLRSVLDPEKHFASETFVHATRESIGLGPRAVVDVEMFLRETEEGLALRAAGDAVAATDRLLHAESLYAGEFLADDPYAEWAVPLREEARAAYIAATRALASSAVERGDHDAAARNYRRVLATDEYDETAHLGLTMSLAAAGRHGEARRTYRAYVEAMDRIGVTPSSFPAASA